MAENQTEIIRQNPIGDSLRYFFESFNSTCKGNNLGIDEALNELNDNDLQDVTGALLVGLNALPVSRMLFLGYKTLRHHLIILTAAVYSEDFDYDRIKPLFRAVIAKESDEEIWAQVRHAISFSPLIDIYESCLECGSSDTEVIREELGPMYVDIPGFHEAFFGRVPDLKRASEAIFKTCYEGPKPLFRQGEGWTGWARDTNEAPALEWLKATIQQLMKWAKHDRQTTDRIIWMESNKPFDNSTRLNFGILSHRKAPADWFHVLVPVGLSSDLRKDGQIGFDIGKYARNIFWTQDTRRFVLAFTLCGSLMRVWQFNRNGGIASTRFDINDDGLQFVTTILGFLWMQDEDLGFDPTFIAFENDKRCIDIIRNGTPERIVIDELMVRVPCIVSRATTCWKAHPEGDPSTILVIKDSWQCPEQDQDPEQDVEGELLREATEKGVCNVSRYYYHETIHVDDKMDDIQHGVRKGLDISKSSIYDSNYYASNYASNCAFNYEIRSPNSSDTSQVSQKSQIPQGSAVGQKRSCSQTSALLPTSKRSRLGSPVKVDLIQPDLPQNRIHRRVIVRDYGQRICKASSCVALLAALESCIQGHESLFKAGILHRDISLNNLIINEDASNHSWPAFLIDLDFAVRVQGEDASNAKRNIGTRPFMAIEVLEGDPHSFEHDLESFFWVLYWICIHYDGPDHRIVVDGFDRWRFLNMETLAMAKRGIVAHEDYFIRDLTRNFTPFYEPLIPWVNRLRGVVFDSYAAKQTLYSRMRDVLREAQRELTRINHTNSNLSDDETCQEIDESPTEIPSRSDGDPPLGNGTMG